MSEKSTKIENDLKDLYDYLNELPLSYDQRAEICWKVASLFERMKMVNVDVVIELIRELKDLKQRLRFVSY